ncbi:methylamine utilization protein [soil metagenome]
MTTDHFPIPVLVRAIPNSRLNIGSAATCAFGMLLSASSAFSAPLTVEVRNAAGGTIADAVVYAEPLANQTQPKTPRAPVEVEQKGRAFLPLVTVVQTGTEISFPNHDTVRHHVYSFSPAKTFEIKLKADAAGAAPILFDKPGTVVVGCNIHDLMLAYIHVVNTPWFGKTNAAGKARIEGLPAGKYTLKAWHPGTVAGTPIAEQELNVAAADASATFTLTLKSGPLTYSY